MKILYTYQGLMQRIGGVSRYFYEIIIRIQKRNDVKICTLFLSNLYFAKILSKPKFKYKGWQHIRLRNTIEDAYMIINLLFKKYDIVHLTGEESHAIRWINKPIVITVHDMIPELFYKNDKRILKRKQTFLKAYAIICVSENTKKDLINLYPNLKKDNIFVIYHGYKNKNIEYKNKLNCNYILYVGSRYEEYKNFKIMIKALSDLVKKYNLKIICTGLPFNQSEKKLIKEYNLEEIVINCGLVSDNDLSSLYHYAECFIYPSLYEGFGIPILEAFSNGCPVCISNSSCFPEIANDAAEYFNPRDINSIASSVEKIITDRNYRQCLITKGFERLKYFSWEKASEDTIKVYNKVYEEFEGKNNQSKI